MGGQPEGSPSGPCHPYAFLPLPLHPGQLPSVIPPAAEEKEPPRSRLQGKRAGISKDHNEGHGKEGRYLASLALPWGH